MAFFDPVIKYIHDHAPHEIGNYVMPYLVVILTVTLILTVIGFNQRIEQNSDTINRIQDAQVDTCKKSGNPLREAVTKQLELQIQQSKNKDLLHQLFPGFPPDELDALVKKSIKQDKELLKEIEPLDCEAIFDSN